MPAPYSPFLIDLGSFQLRWYSVLIVLGIFIAIWIAKREFLRRGYRPEIVDDFAFLVVPLGIIGGRLYHVFTTLDYYRDHWLEAFQIWRGGLGIYGAVALGAVGVYIMTRIRRIPFAVVTDCIAPGLVIAQAIGRWGNYFNQEIFGPPTNLPWGLYVDPAYRPAAYAAFERFHPTFLYESLWNVALGLALIWLSRRYWRVWLPGTISLIYLTGYTFIRFLLENLKVDDVLHIAGFRFNFLSSLAAFLFFSVWLIIWLRRANSRPYPVGPLLRDGDGNESAAPGASTHLAQQSGSQP